MRYNLNKLCQSVRAAAGAHYRLILLLALIPLNVFAQEKCDMIIHNKCFSCDTPFAFPVANEISCGLVCPNRRVNNSGSFKEYIQNNCMLKKCPENLPYRDEFGSCTASEDGKNTYADEFRKQTFNDDPIPEAMKRKKIRIVEGTCPDDYPLLRDGECYSCEEPEILYIPASECRKCPNRTHTDPEKYCSLICPPDKPLKRWDGMCFSCSEPKSVQIDRECNSDKDCNVCPNRIVVKGPEAYVFSVPKCPSDKPLIDDEGMCFSCDFPGPVALQWNSLKCDELCPGQREMYGYGRHCWPK